MIPNYNCDYLHKGSDYKSGDIRLVGGSYAWEGRVEIYLNREWGTISDQQHRVRDAHVVCQQLGYDIRCELLTTYPYHR